MLDFSIDRRGVLAGTVGLAAFPAVADAADVNGIALSDTGWRLWVDEEAPWRDDTLYLPEDADLGALPVNPPTGGWGRLNAGEGRAVTLPATVEQFYWGRFGSQPYTLAEYNWAPRDPVPRNGAWRGVSWWWRSIEIPAGFAGKRLLLTVRGARQRAEVYLNRKLVGYSILEELPFVCDVTAAANPGGDNQLAIRITNPGGRYDWVDSASLTWGKVKLQSSHGFGGLDRGISLAAHPVDGHIEDTWVLNRPQPRTATAFVKLAGAADGRHLSLHIEDVATGKPVRAVIAPDGRSGDGVQRFSIACRDAVVWDLDTPHLYRLVVCWQSPAGGDSRRAVTFGFRWFAPDGVGKDALFRLNGRRIRLYSAISWGFWGLNGLWPVPDLAEKEVTQAKALGLNCLNFHRNIGKKDVMDAQDRLGLLRCMEPGGGRIALGPAPRGAGADVDTNGAAAPPADSAADAFNQRYVTARCLAMVRAFRSHPSLMQYTLQNEISADLAKPVTTAILAAMRAEDESRIVALNDGLMDPPWSQPQAWFEPYSDKLHRSDQETWGAWFDRHQGADEQWYDRFYKGPDDFVYRMPFREGIVQFGEMEGCAVPDNQVLAIAEILQRGGSSYDLEDRRQSLAPYDVFLDRWGFRDAFPKTESLFLAVGRKSYESWQQYLENIRINEVTDYASISGWESTAIENHSGIVDNLRNFKSDPAIIRASLLPLRPVAKQRAMVVAKDASAVFDLWLLNDTGKIARGTLRLRVTDPSGAVTEIGAYDAPPLARDQFSVLVKDAVTSPPLTREGMHRFVLSMPGAPDYVRDILVVDDKLHPVAGKVLRVALQGVLPVTRAQFARLPGVVVEDYAEGAAYDAIVVSGLTEKSNEAQRLGGDAGLRMQRDKTLTSAPGEAPASTIAALKSGTPLLVIAQEDGLADGLANQLAAAGAFTYRGQVGRTRVPWMGSWMFVRSHPVYAGLPVNQAMTIHYQAHGRQANGLLVDGPDVDVFVGYGRDHDRQVGASSFTARLGRGKLLFQRVPDMNGPMQQRFLRNALAWLCT